MRPLQDALDNQAQHCRIVLVPRARQAIRRWVNLDVPSRSLLGDEAAA